MAAGTADTAMASLRGTMVLAMLGGRCHAAGGRTVQSLDGEGTWQLSNAGLGPLPNRTVVLLPSHGLVDAPRGSWAFHPRQPPTVQTALGTLPASTAAGCCSACAATALCGGAVWTAGHCEMRSANSVSHPLPATAARESTSACVLAGGGVELAATVPGDVNVELMAAGLLPDLLHSTNSMAARYVPQYEWLLSTTFMAAAFSPGADAAWLHLAGVDYNCSVALNGKLLLAHHAGSFRPIDLDVTHALIAGGSNTLTVTLHAPPAGYLASLFVTNDMEGGAKTTCECLPGWPVLEQTALTAAPSPPLLLLSAGCAAQTRPGGTSATIGVRGRRGSEMAAGSTSARRPSPSGCGSTSRCATCTGQRPPEPGWMEGTWWRCRPSRLAPTT